MTIADWKLVPIKPTPAMLEAGYRARDKWPNHMCDNQAELMLSFSEPRWQAMLAAAPKAPDLAGLTIEDEYVRTYLWERGLIAVDENPALRETKETT